jgi:hypothetical protein
MSKLKELNKLKIIVEKNCKILDNNVNAHKENVLNHKLKVKQFEENIQCFKNLLKEFALSNIQNGKLKLTQIMKNISSKNDKFNEVIFGYTLFFFKYAE